MKLTNYVLLISLLFLSGCSSKQYFEPTDKELKGEYNLKSPFIKNKITKKILFEYEFDKNIISSTTKNNMVALGFSDNSIVLFDKKDKKILFQEYLNKSIINDIKIANPIFLKSIVLYPTLNGKIIIVDIKKRVKIKTINIDPQNNINNIIFLSQIGDTLVSATPNKLFTFANGSVNIKDFNIKRIVVKDKFIYIITLEGNIIKFDENLKEIANKKFKFAKFLALSVDENIYALESQEYLIKLDKNMKEVNIYNFNN